MKKQIISLLLAALLLSQTAIAPLPITADPAPDKTETADPLPSSPLTKEEEAPPVSYTHEISDGGLELIKSFEGFSAYPYWDYKQYSYGYGSYCETSTVYADPGSPTGFSTSLYPDGIPEREAAELLRDMVDQFNVALNNLLVKYQILLNQNQFDALASIGYNLGYQIWSKDTNSLRNALIAGDYTKEELTEIIGSYCKAGGVKLEALYQRRMREAEIFFSPYSMSDPDADLYVVNVSNNLVIRQQPSKTSAWKGQVKGSKVIRVHKYSDDGKWAYTSYCGYYGWVDMSYLVSIDADGMVTKVDGSGCDDAGLHYTFDNLTMTATVGGAGESNSSGYDGSFAGDVYLTQYLLYNDAIYRLTGISDTAFRNCEAIDTIYIPSAITQIGNDAFGGSTLQEIFYTDGSYAEDWAKSSGFTYTDLRCRDGHTSSDWLVIVPASDSEAQTEARSCAVCREPQTRKHERIEITSYPTKIEYKEGEALRTDGLAIRVVYSDGSTAKVSPSAVSGYDPALLGTQTITVSYSIFTTTFRVEVSQRILTGITISAKPSKLTYIEGQEMSYSGLSVQANYDDNTHAAVKEYSVSGYDKNKVGKQTITVTYNGKTATFQVTVKAKSLTSIQIANYPNTMEYFCGDALDTTGLRLKLFYDNGTTAYVTKGFTVSGYKKDTAGTQSVKVTYGGKSQTMRVTVHLNYLKSDTLEIKDEILTALPAGTTVGWLREQFESDNRVLVVRNGMALSDTATLSTGYSVQLIFDDTVQDSATIVILGDLTGDGRCSISDFLMVSDHLMGARTLTAMETLAGDLNGDGAITLADYYAMYELTKFEDPSQTV